MAERGPPGSGLTINPAGLTPSDEKLETNKMIYDEFFIIHGSYKSVIYDSSMLRQNSEGGWSKIVHAPFVDINNEGDRISFTVRRALSCGARHEMETEYIAAYLENPKFEFSGDRSIYTDIEITLDDYDTPGDYEMSFDVAGTGTLKISGTVNICGPKIIIESKTKGSVDLRELKVIRKCMSPDCIWIHCDEGIDEEMLQVMTDENAKLVAGVSEKQYAITIWSR